jgi:hypothetical protein
MAPLPSPLRLGLGVTVRDFHEPTAAYHPSNATAIVAPAHRRPVATRQDRCNRCSVAVVAIVGYVTPLTLRGSKTEVTRFWIPLKHCLRIVYNRECDELAKFTFIIKSWVVLASLTQFKNCAHLCTVFHPDFATQLNLFCSTGRCMAAWSESILDIHHPHFHFLFTISILLYSILGGELEPPFLPLLH